MATSVSTFNNVVSIRPIIHTEEQLIRDYTEVIDLAKAIYELHELKQVRLPAAEIFGAVK